MDNQRLILLLVFSFSLIMLWDAWVKQGQPHPAPGTTTSVPAATVAAAPAPTSGLPVPGAKAAAVPATPANATAARASVKTDLFSADISALGGDIVRLELLKHRATENTKNNFVLFDDRHAYAAQSGLIGANLPNHRSIWTLPTAGLELKDGQDELRVRLEAAGGDGIKVAKTYVFRRGSYLVGVEHEVVNGGAAAVTPNVYFQLSRNSQAPEGGNAMMSTFTGPAFYTDAEKYHKVDFADITKGKAKAPAQADNGWVGMVQHYFVSAWLPAAKAPREFFIRKLGDDLFAAGVIVPMAAIAPGASGKLETSLFAGPQEQDKLAKVAPGLDLVVDYGWLTVIAAPLFWVLEAIYKFVGNWGWAIIGLTVMLKLIFFPLSAASYKSMAKMRVLTPKLTKLKETYADDRQRMNQEMMELYKKEKVNPLGGCLPIVVQIPVFIALYWVLLGTVEMRGAPWLGWITDLSAKDPYFIMPLIMGVTMFVQTKLNPTPPDPIQAKVMLFMPIVFTGMFLFFPAGLVLYWTVNNVLSIAQQWQVNRMIESAGLKAH
ncbi:membrane protein insertase YidC [Sulfurisoma sediminicola]|uniref:Membrane protein insertase YidC n=1 Tax=Sulfurisoma sediminicola TaxID=1381557 RepID=A0A497XLK8_9PROT|nr:membrane protein insertase YidC [Sulfurisoma sediminicola]RLJ68195.1 protein translocase subunit yidC [Sulfurisoma sediminicola]